MGKKAKHTHCFQFVTLNYLVFPFSLLWPVMLKLFSENTLNNKWFSKKLWTFFSKIVKKREWTEVFVPCLRWNVLVCVTLLCCHLCRLLEAILKKRAKASMGESHSDPVGVDALTMPMTSQHATSSDVAYAPLLVRGPAGSGEVWLQSPAISLQSVVESTRAEGK